MLLTPARGRGAARSRPLAVLAGLLIAVLPAALAGCGGDDDPLARPATSASPSAPAPATKSSAPPAPASETPTETTPAPEPVETTPAPPATPEPEPEPTTETAAPSTPYSGSGSFATAPLDAPAMAGSQVVRVAVQVEDGVPVDPMDFATQIRATLTDPRGWQPVDGIAFEFTSDPGSAAFIVTLATPATTDRLCYPLDTGGWLDCYSRGRAVINSDRWLLGADSWGADIAGYRQMVVNHEVGHALGHGHLYCPGAGAPAPVMQQQTISLQGCAPNAWPTVTGG